MSNTLVALPNVSAPCVTTNPCTCPTYGPGGVYLPVQIAPDAWECRLALEVGPPTQPVPALDPWALAGLLIALVFVGARRLR